MISVKRVAQTCRVLVRGAPPSVTKDYISLYFEKHAATDVTDIQQSDDFIIITFANFEGDASILVLLFGRSFVKQFTLSYRTVILSVCLSVSLSVTLVYCGQTVRWIRMKPGMQVGLDPGHIVLDRDPTPPKKGAQLTKFPAHVCCGQTAGWIKMPFDMELGLGPGDIVLDGDPAPPKRGTAPSIFGPCPLWPNGWMDQDATWYGGRPRPK